MNRDGLDLAGRHNHHVSVEHGQILCRRWADFDRPHELQTPVLILLDLGVEFQKATVEVCAIHKTKANVDAPVRVPVEGGPPS